MEHFYRQAPVLIFRLFICLGVVSLLVLPIAKYHALHSNVFDLGLFLKLLYQVGANEQWQLAFSGHSQPVLLLYGQIYRMLHADLAPYLLLLLQSALLLLPFFLLLSRFGKFYAAVYLLYVPVWINAHFDFHADHLAVPILCGFYLSLLNKRVFLATLFASLLVFVKEPFALQTAACGIFMFCIAVFRDKAVVGNENTRFRVFLGLAGGWLVLFGLGSFYFALEVIWPFFTPGGEGGGLSGGAFAWLGQGFNEIVRTVITNPHLVLWDVVTTPGKLLYLLIVFGLLGFVPLLKPTFLIPALPPLIIALLSQNPGYYDYNTHYTAGVIIPAMFAFVFGTKRLLGIGERLLESRWKSSGRVGNGPEPRYASLLLACLFLWVALGHIALAPSPAARLFWSDKVWSYSTNAYIETSRDRMIKEAIKQHVPRDDNVWVASQNTLNWALIAHRKVYLSFPRGVTEPYKATDISDRSVSDFLRHLRTDRHPEVIQTVRFADYVVLDLNRPYFLADRGCDWLFGRCQNEAIQNRFLDAVNYARRSYGTLHEEDGFMILKREEK